MIYGDIVAGGDTNIRAREAKKIASLLAFLVAIVLLLSPFTPVIYTRVYAVFHPTLFLNMKPYDEVTLDDLQYQIDNRMYVPNYDAEILISFDNEGKFRLGSYASFRISIIDKGIIKMTKPYYYSFIVDPDGNVKAIFPEPAGSISIWSKWAPWRTNYYEIDALEIIQDGKTYQIPRSTLIKGYGKYLYYSRGKYYWSIRPHLIKLRFQLEETYKPGMWYVYVLFSMRITLIEKETLLKLQMRSHIPFTHSRY